MPSSKAIQKDYRQYAPVYEEKWAHFLSPPREWILNDLQRHHLAEARLNICDLGCGTAALLSQIHDLYPGSIPLGADISKDMLGQAKTTLPQGKFCTFDFDNELWPLEDGNHDIIFSLFLLHHLKCPDAFLQHVKMLMQDRTRFYLADFAIDGWKMQIAETYWRWFKPSHHKAFSQKKLTKMITEAGFIIEEQELFKPDDFWRMQIYKLKKK